MKKVLCVFLVLIMVLAFVACESSQETGTVTIYILEKEEGYYRNGTLKDSVTYLYEDGWQEKDSFTVTMNDNMGTLVGPGTIAYSKQKAVQKVVNGTHWEHYFDENGNKTKAIDYYSGHRLETVYTYDALGRLISEERKTIYTDTAQEPSITTWNYTCVDTATGSRCTYSSDGNSDVIEYDQNGRMISRATLLSGRRDVRIEITYNDDGIVITETSYKSDGRKDKEMKYIYKAVEVSKETAARLPQFKKAN